MIGISKTSRSTSGAAIQVLLALLTVLVLAGVVFFVAFPDRTSPPAKSETDETPVGESPQPGMAPARIPASSKPVSPATTGSRRKESTLVDASSAAGPAPAPARPADASAVIQRLTQLVSGKPLSPEEAAAVKEEFARLAAQGASAIPEIRKLLEEHRDWSLDDAKGTGSVGYGSVRTGLFDVLRQIGGPEAQSALAGALQTTGSPAEIGLLARHLEELAPGQHRDEIVNAARETLAQVAGNKSKLDVGHLFQVLQNYGNAEILSDIRKTMPDYQHYAFMALVGLPDGQGIPTLIQEVKNADAGASARSIFAVQMLAQVAPGNPDASAALIEQASAGRISDRAWQRVAEALAGDQYQFAKDPNTDASALLRTPGVKTYHINSGNENFYSVPLSSLQTQDAAQRIALIDQLLAANPGAAAAQALQRAKAALAK